MKSFAQPNFLTEYIAQRNWPKMPQKHTFIKVIASNCVKILPLTFKSKEK